MEPSTPFPSFPSMAFCKPFVLSLSSSISAASFTHPKQFFGSMKIFALRLPYWQCVFDSQAIIRVEKLLSIGGYSKAVEPFFCTMPKNVSLTFFWQVLFVFLVLVKVAFSLY